MVSGLYIPRSRGRRSHVSPNDVILISTLVVCSVFNRAFRSAVSLDAAYLTPTHSMFSVRSWPLALGVHTEGIRYVELKSKGIAIRQQQTHSRVGARLSASAACRKLSMWRTPRAAPRLIALAPATLRFPPLVPHRAYLLSRAVLSRRDRPRSVHRASPPVATLAHELAPTSLGSLSSSGPRSLPLPAPPPLSLILAFPVRYPHAPLSFSRSSSISILFPHFPPRFRRISVVFFFHSPSLLRFLQASRLFFSSLFFVFSSSLMPWHTAVPSRLRAAEKVFRRLILRAMPRAYERRPSFYSQADTWIFPLELAVAVRQPGHLNCQPPHELSKSIIIEFGH